MVSVGSYMKSTDYFEVEPGAWRYMKGTVFYKVMVCVCSYMKSTDYFEVKLALGGI